MTLGVSYKDAQYYAELDNKFIELERNKVVIDLSDVEALSTQFALANPNSFKEMVMELDPAAIKTALQSSSYVNGFDDVNELMEKNPNRAKYEIQYNDGSSVSVISSPGEPQEKKEVTPSAYEEDIYWVSAHCGGSSCINASTEWTFTSALGYAKASIFNLNYGISYNGKDTYTMTVGNYDVGAASYGVVTYSTPSKNTISSATYYVPNWGPPTNAQAQGYFNATVSASVGGSLNFAFGSLSLSVNGGASWTQYVNYRVFPFDLVHAAAGYYK